MVPFRLARDRETGEEIFETALAGPLLLAHPLLNKGSAFSEQERKEFGLLGLLPPGVATMEEQLLRTYENYRRKDTDLERYIYLISLQDRNETLFYRLLQEHVTEMMPIVYTPTVGAACQRYSHIYRRPRGLYISFPSRDRMGEMLANSPVTDARVIVVTDGERILGLGDLGVGGMGIPVGKLTLYTVCAGIHPATTLPVILDVGTDNQELLQDPLYLGWRRVRVRGQEYDDFVEMFIHGVMQRFPNALLQWEDFAKSNAGRLLDRYRDRLRTFNDDIQGTGAVTLAGLLAAMLVTGAKISDQRVVILGAGSAAKGISDLLVRAMKSGGLPESEAKSSIWLVDSQGLVHTARTGLEGFKKKYAQPVERFREWDVAGKDHILLLDVVRNVHPTILIGTSAQPAAFTEKTIREMAKWVERPIIFPLSNPTSKSEAAPADLFHWTGGKALVATGSPFPDVSDNARSIRIGQCNNSFIFPGVGLGVIAVHARRVTEEMFLAAAFALSELSPARSERAAPLYPSLEEVRNISRRVALAVGAEAQRSGVAEETSSEELSRHVDDMMWTPGYVPLKRAAGF